MIWTKYMNLLRTHKVTLTIMVRFWNFKIYFLKCMYFIKMSKGKKKVTNKEYINWLQEKNPLTHMGQQDYVDLKHGAWINRLKVYDGIWDRLHCKAKWLFDSLKIKSDYLQIFDIHISDRNVQKSVFSDKQHINLKI